MHSTNFGFTLAAIALMTPFISCHVIRRDAPSVTSMASNEVTHRTTALYSSENNQLPNQEWQDDSGSEVNNILGVMAQAGWDDGSSDESYSHSQQSHDEDVDINSSTAEMSTSTTSADSSTTSETYSTSSSNSSELSSTTSTPLSTTSTPLSTTSTPLSTPSTPSSTTSVTPPMTSTQTQSTGTSDPFDGATTRCQEPPEHQLRLNFKRPNQHLKFPALAILPKEGSLQDIRPETLELSDGDEYVNATDQCPIELLHVTRSDDLSRRSLCPWSYVPNVDPNRYPSIIQIAKCRCRNCIDTTASEEGAFSNENNCHQVKFTMTVLRRGECVNGMYMYHNALESIPVACACVRPKV